MFENLIYYNKKKIDQYSALILGKNIETKTTDKNGLENIAANYLLECFNFEKILQNRDDFVDYINDNQNISIKNIRISSIIRVTGEIYIPEQFDMVHLIDQYKDFIFAGVDYQDNEQRELMTSVLNNSKVKIPIFCELGGDCDYWMGIGKVSQEDMLIIMI